MYSSKSQIIATIGPASGDKEVLRELVDHQMDVARLNFSWGSFADHHRYIENVRIVAGEKNKYIPIIQDLPGPRVQKGRKHTFKKQESVLTEQDKEFIQFGIEHSVDYVAVSFVSSAEDIENARREIEERGGSIPVIAKIERPEAVENIREIVAVSNAIMIARGDLGDAIPFERMPFIQLQLIQEAKRAGKPVITATGMLLSMVDSPTPARSEVTDIAYAIVSGSDAVMLSEETAIGKYPVEAVTAMEKIVVEAEKYQDWLPSIRSIV